MMRAVLHLETYFQRIQLIIRKRADARRYQIIKGLIALIGMENVELNPKRR
jgi:hypothetical protein